MRKIALFLVVTSLYIMRMECQAIGKIKETDEYVPFVTKIMSAQELKQYLKQKGISRETKFNKLELVWERTLDKSIQSIQDISGISRDGNSIVVTDSTKSLIFLNSKGITQKEIDLGGKRYAVAKSGNAAVIAEWKDNLGVLTVAYYDGRAREIWKKKYKLKSFQNILISNNGETICIQEGNPKWNLEEWDAKGDLNVSKLLFIDNNGCRLYEYTNFRNMGWGEFSEDGNYFAGLFWLQKDLKIWGKLKYINVRERKILWEKPFGGNWSRWGEQFGDEENLAISEHGSYIAAIDMVPAEKIPQGADPLDYFEVLVFDRHGKKIARFKDTWVYSIRENGLIFSGGRKSRRLVDVVKLKMVNFKDYRSNVDAKTGYVLNRGEWDYDINFDKSIIYSNRIINSRTRHRFVNFYGDLLFEKEYPSDIGVVSFTTNANYIKALGNKVIILRLSGD